ncbi:hypothetical protein SDC9_137387 [bioreactor metagenome]|uniref:Uncharacterized protein n=1 Tax=bioreactor metagenome TaxID=1076179 RepID=A0A645DLQ8_9ZZZZ
MDSSSLSIGDIVRKRGVNNVRPAHAALGVDEYRTPEFRAVVTEGAVANGGIGYAVLPIHHERTTRGTERLVVPECDVVNVRIALVVCPLRCICRMGIAIHTAPDGLAQISNHLLGHAIGNGQPVNHRRTGNAAAPGAVDIQHGTHTLTIQHAQAVVHQHRAFRETGFRAFETAIQLEIAANDKTFGLGGLGVRALLQPDLVTAAGGKCLLQPHGTGPTGAVLACVCCWGDAAYTARILRMRRSHHQERSAHP